MSNRFEKTLRYGIMAAIVAVPVAGDQERVERTELSLDHRVLACMENYQTRVEQLMGDKAEVLTFLGCSAMESCRTGQTTEEIVTELSVEQLDTAGIAQRALPMTERLTQEFDMRQCVQIEILAPEGSDGPSYSQRTRGLVPEIFYGDS